MERYEEVHFRDYMAIQLTALAGTTAFQDRMGASHPDLVAQGRIVQGHDVSGPLSPRTSAAIDRDLGDQRWRDLFHRGVLEDRRFQRGLFDATHGMTIGDKTVPGPAALLELLKDAHRTKLYTVALIKELSAARLPTERAYEYEYGMALLKTSASLVYTATLAFERGWTPVTDSSWHFRLLERTCERENADLPNDLIPRSGY